MYKKVCSLMFLLIFSGTMVFGVESAESFFKRLRAETLQNLPQQFTARLDGPTIDQKIKSIPSTSYIKAGVNPQVKLTFDKKEAISIKVENVDELYEGLFAQYVRLFTLGPILTSISDEQLLERYDFEMQYSGSGLVKLRIQLKEAQNSFLAYVNPSTMQILRIDYFMGTEILSSTLLKYRLKKRSGKSYQIPNMFMVQTFKPKQNKPESFKLEDISIP